MTGIDPSHGKLMFPPRFVPYLEKHRIFELFHELTELLIQERPKDHVKFLRSVLPCAAKRRDKPRVVFFAPPSFDRAGFAKEIQRILDIPGITRFHLVLLAKAERLKSQKSEIAALEEEYSCVCPEEYDLGVYKSPFKPSRVPADYFDLANEYEVRSSDMTFIYAGEQELEVIEEKEQEVEGEEEQELVGEKELEIVEEAEEKQSEEAEEKQSEESEEKQLEEAEEKQLEEEEQEQLEEEEEKQLEEEVQELVEEEQEMVGETELELVEEDEDPCKGFRVCPCKEKPVEEEDKIIPTAEVGATEKFYAEETDEASVSATTTEHVSSEHSTTDQAPPITEEPTPGRKSTGKYRRRSQKKQSRSAPVTSHDGSAKKTTSSSELGSCVCESSEGIEPDYSVLGKCDYSEKGWILIDFPRSAEEAEALSEQGAFPTHAIRIHTGGEEERNREYKCASQDWAAVYSGIPVTDIYLNGRSIPQLAEGVGRLLRSMPHRHAPMLPRIALIGSRGSGANTQAKLLSKKYKIIHVDFEEEMARVILRGDKYGEIYKRQLMTRPDPELEAAILEKILLTSKCQKNGWVITGFPTNTDQLRMFDLMATPPNRIIFIEVPAKECFLRLYYRQTDWMNGKEYTPPVIVPEGVEGRNAVGLEPEVKQRLMAHPRDDKRLIISDIERYFEEKDEMMKYCGKTAACVNGNKSIESVFEQIDHILIHPSPAAPPRDPLAVGQCIREAYDRLQSIRMEDGLTVNNLLANPPDPIFKM